MEPSQTTELPPSELANIQQYFSVLVQAYGRLHPAKHPKSKTSVILNQATASQATSMAPPANAIDQKQFMTDLKVKILGLEAAIAGARPATRDERQRLRKIETRLELYRVRLEKLETRNAG